MSFNTNFNKYDFPKLGYIKIPKLDIPKEDIERLKLKDGPKTTSEDYLLALLKENFDVVLKQWSVESERKKYLERLKLEYEEIKRLLFVDYILLVYRVVQFCKKNNILNGPGRGSGGGSLLLAILGCVQADPIKHNLLFERFISSARTETKEIDGELYISSAYAPDFDLDTMASQKHRVNELLDSFFPQKTASICNISTFQSKAILKEVYKCYEDATEDEAKEISDLIEIEFGKVQRIQDAIKENPYFNKWSIDHPETIKIAQNLHELNKNISKHASGIIICNDDIENCMPIILDREKNAMVGYTMDYAQMFGIKFDNLGLKNLNVVNECLELINKKMIDIDVNDKSIYDYLNNNDTYYGVFQAEDCLGKKVMRSLKCQNINDLGLSIAIGRPGSMSFLGDILKAKNNNELNDWGKRINDVLKNNYNCIVYQEDIMALCRVMANFTPLESNLVRKIIGKKQSDQMVLWKDKFINQSIQNGFAKEIVEKIWETFDAAGKYLFNLSHSTNYSYLTAICTYLKANYPIQFYYSSLKNAKYEQKPHEEITTIYSEMFSKGIKLLPPHILKSEMDFNIENDSVRMGIGNIKGISEKAIEKLKLFKTSHSNKFQIFQAANECKIPTNIMTALIMVGSLDDMLTETRSKTMMENYLWNILTEKEKQLCLHLGEKYKFDLIGLIKELSTKIKNENGKYQIKESRLQTIRKKFQPFYEIYSQNSKNEEFARYFFEKKLIGFSYSSRLFDIFNKKCEDLYSLYEANTSLEKENVKVIGEITDIIEGRSKKNNNYYKLTMDDGTATAQILLVNSAKTDTLQNVLDSNDNQKPKTGDIVIVRGQKGADIIFGKTLTIQKTKIFEKISQIQSLE